MNTGANVRFTSTESFQLFAQGLESLQAYESNAAHEKLDGAEIKLQACVSKYPHDVLPRFYLGVVKTLRGYAGLDEAIREFEYVLKSGIEELVPDAMFNLAVAHIERYTPADFQKASELLEETRREIQTRRASVKYETLRLQAKILEAFIFIRQSAWVDRKRNPPSSETIRKSEDLLRDFKSDYDKAAILETARPDLLADFENVRGLLAESRAWVPEGETARKQHAAEAVSNYEDALEQKIGWIPAKSNLARVYQEVLGQLEIAEKLLRDVIEVRPDDQYSYYMLGRNYDARDDESRAIPFYEKAPQIPSANFRLGTYYEKRQDLERALFYYHKAGELPDAKIAIARLEKN
jgi:tetratricopeptide (TPR) repeat protein